MARRLIDSGFTKVFVLKGGWREWEKAKFPVEPKGLSVSLLVGSKMVGGSENAHLFLPANLRSVKVGG